MRILLAGTGIEPIPPTGYGGVERSISEYAAALRSAGHSATVVQRIRKRRSIDEYWFALELPRLLRVEQFEVIHASTPVVANRLAGKRLPYVYTSHSRHWFERKGLRQGWGFYLERRAVARSGAAVALSETLARRIQSELGPRTPRLEVIPIGVDTERFVPDWSQRTGVRAVGVGAIARWKRWELAVRALRGTGVDLTILGPIRDQQYARELADLDPSVRLPGEVTDDQLRATLSASDFMIHPSRVELMAGAVLQGLAAGLPVIGGIAVRDLVTDGSTGFLFEQGPDSPAAVDLIRELANRLAADAGLRRRMGEAARASAISGYSWPVVVSRHIELYRKVLGPSRPGSPDS